MRLATTIFLAPALGALLATAAAEAQPRGTSLEFGPESALTSDPLRHAVEPAWRADGRWISYVLASDDGLATYALDPEGTSSGAILRVSPRARDGRPGPVTLVPEDFAGGPAGADRNAQVRYSPARIEYLGGEHWVIAWHTTLGASEIWSQIDEPGSAESRRLVSRRRPEDEITANEPQYAEFSAPGMDPADASAVWLLHEENDAAPGGGWNDSVRSLVSLDPSGARRTEIVALNSRGENHKRPVWSRRVLDGYSRGCALLFPLIEASFRRYIRVADAFDAEAPVRTAIEEKPDVATVEGVFSPDGRHFAFVARGLRDDPRLRQRVPDVDGGSIWVAAFPADRRDDRAWPIANAVPHGDTPLVRRVSSEAGATYAGPIRWDASGTRLLYLAKIAGRWQVVCRELSFADAFAAPSPLGPEIVVSIARDADHFHASFAPCPEACGVVYQRQGSGGRFQIFGRRRLGTACGGRHFR